ncbi:MAG: GGDEF domain-containing protein [Candidatus Dormibacteria bacterium]
MGRAGNAGFAVSPRRCEHPRLECFQTNSVNMTRAFHAAARERFDPGSAGANCAPVTTDRELLIRRGRADQSLTARDELRLRAETRRSLRTATKLGGITAAGLMALLGLGIVLVFPGREAQMLAIAAFQIMVDISVLLLVRGRLRLPPLPIAFVLALSNVGTVLSMLVLLSEIRFTTLMLLAIFPPAVALFLPWSVRVQAAWLLVFAAALLAISVSTLGAAVSVAEWIGVWLALVISAVTSLVGCASASKLRRRAFVLQMLARRAHAKTVARETELECLNGELAQATRTDPLTGLGNRLRMDAEITAATARATRYGNECTIVMFDLDRFKDYNDALGHIAGDAALCSVATAMAATVRAVDIVCRFGGEEFVVLMPEQSLEGGARAAERIRCAIEGLQLQYPTPRGPKVLTISAGIALLGRSQAHDEDEILRTADAALYRAKRAGRNRVEGMPVSAERTSIAGPVEAGAVQ